jgi:Zn ribbon nucleic-acid-binding protein
MSKKDKTGDFIIKAIKKHGNKYDYSKVDYLTAHFKIIIICPIHGDFDQTPNSHLNGCGCRKCGYTQEKWSKEFFINEALKRNNGYLPYDIIGDYKGTTENIIIRDKYGECSIRANHILNGVVPGLETAINPIQYFINKAEEVHGNLYSYDNVDYINSRTKILITCKIHGNFQQEPNSHLSGGAGCPSCASEKRGKLLRLNNIKFVEKATKIHGDKYDYSLVDYINSKNDVIINCKIHGEFKQNPSNHFGGKGCPKCALIGSAERLRDNPTGWDYTNWQKAGKRGKNFDSFKVYIIRCWNDDEEFYKIGKTFNTVRYRLRSGLPYNYDVIIEISNEARIICELEWNLKNCNKYNKYIPQKEFGGRYECFKQLDMSCFEEYNLEIEKTFK